MNSFSLLNTCPIWTQDRMHGLWKVSSRHISLLLQVLHGIYAINEIQGHHKTSQFHLVPAAFYFKHGVHRWCSCTSGFDEEKCHHATSILILLQVHKIGKSFLVLVLNIAQLIKAVQDLYKPDIYLLAVVGNEIHMLDLEWLPASIWQRGICIRFNLMAEISITSSTGSFRLTFIVKQQRNREWKKLKRKRGTKTGKRKQDKEEISRNRE